MKKQINKQFLMVVMSFVLGASLMYAYTRAEIQKNKEITARIIKTSISSLQASQSLANSCSEAYTTVTNCVSNLNSCNLQKEAQKLDSFELQKEQANEQITNSNREFRAIIKDYWPNQQL